ncbi:hypothetical protein EB796_007493 [Bugula neritina]|uniref:B box-type domain-containing protein n=1 Tax=Bugula neritina TaxID=10212 RepID=A0A7J7K7J2_BUGNE|nr:hypothetical protein EB796_007493 [Bugula neritina]
MKEVFDIELETLPTPDTKEPPLCCDSCKRKGGDNQLAVVYCTTCSAKLCAKHREFHDEVVEGHPIIAISEYRTNAGKFRPRLCADHTELEYTLGCKKCLTLACTRCLSSLENCSDSMEYFALYFVPQKIIISLFRNQSCFFRTF